MLRVDVDTVAVAVPDAFGRLIGKRLTYAAWQRAVSAGVLAMPEFHLITDARNVPVSGSPVTGVQNGFRNGLLAPDRSTERRLPWDESTTIVLCDALGPDGQPAEAAPRWVLRRQVERLSALGLSSGFASELEFYLYQTSYEHLAETEYRAPRPAYHRAGDNDLLVDSIVEPLLGDIRRLMPQAGIPIELSQGEGGVGQFEVSLRYAPPVEMADHHAVYKLGVKTLAQRRGLAVTFMAKPETAQVGSSCHVHVSLRDESGANAVCGRDDRLTRIGEQFLAGLLAYSSELCLLFAPTTNSYRRLLPGSWAPAAVTWGVDNRTALVRLCGAPGDRRFEFRVPGADANPYLAFAGILAAGIGGIEQDLSPPPPTTGDASILEGATVLPRDLAEAITRFAGSELAVAGFGSDVCANLVALARQELDVARREVTDRDRARYFEVA
jgi:glutamine synthetase